MKLHPIRCSQCGARTQGRELIARACGQCTTLLVCLGGEVHQAAAFDGSLPREGTTLALVCRCCAGALPTEVLKEGANARCGFCGQPATLPPRLRVLLKLALTKPSVVPDLGRIFHQWLAVLAAFALLLIISCQMRSPALRHDEILSLQPTVPSLPSGQMIPLQARSETVEIRRNGNSMPYLSLNFWDPEERLLKDSKVRILVSVVREATGERREQWLEFEHQSTPEGSVEKPMNRQHAEFYFRPLTGRMEPLAIGFYHIEITKAEVLRGTLPPQIDVEWRTYAKSGVGIWILAANLLLWLFVFDFRRAASAPLGRPAPQWTGLRTAAVVALLMCAVNLLIPLGSLGNEGIFEAKVET